MLKDSFPSRRDTNGEYIPPVRRNRAAPFRGLCGHVLFKYFPEGGGKRNGRKVYALVDDSISPFRVTIEDGRIVPYDTHVYNGLGAYVMHHFRVGDRFDRGFIHTHDAGAQRVIMEIDDEAYNYLTMPVKEV